MYIYITIIRYALSLKCSISSINNRAIYTRMNYTSNLYLYITNCYSFSDRQYKVFWFHALLKTSLKSTLSSVRLILQDVKLIAPVNSNLLRNTYAKASPRKSCSKDFAKFRVNVTGRVHLQKNWKRLQLY